MLIVDCFASRNKEKVERVSQATYTKEKKMITPLAATANETDLLTYEVSDEALETAAGAAGEQVNFTLGSCTGLSECPA